MSLANKYRPKTFDDVVGQDYAVKILRTQAEKNTPNNCYLFLAPAGVGKTTLARIYAKALNNSDSYIEVDAASKNSVDDMDALVIEAGTRSLNSTYKIFIIDECHALSNQAWQVLLKTLEEAPKHTIFLLCTTEGNKVPDTIKSRSMLLQLSSIPYGTLLNRLQYIDGLEGHNISADILEYIARVSRGGLRAAISSYEQIVNAGARDMREVRKVLTLGIPDAEMKKLIDNIGNVEELTKQLATLFNDYTNPNFIKDSIVSYIANVLKFLYTKEIRFTTLLEVPDIDANDGAYIVLLRRLLKRLYNTYNVTFDSLYAVLLDD